MNIFEEKIRGVLNRASSDSAFRKSLNDSPAEALAQAGVPIKKNTELRVMSDTADTVHFVFPPEPGGEHAVIADESLDGVAGGGFGVCLFTIGSTASSLDPHGGFDQ